MNTIGISVNGHAVTASVEPRTHLADFLRDHLNLTGTHLGCEHGVCGSCTLLLDDAPARSCITLAAACDRARVTTIEGLDDDEIAGELRAAFTREHALQCGYCTPGMIVSARDLVLRLDDADERAIRVGLSGNLCRCTGYVGIVRAVRSVIDDRRRRGIAPLPGAAREQLGPVGSTSSAGDGGPPAARPSARAGIEQRPAVTIPDFVPDRILEDHFTLASRPEEVFAMLGDVARVAACLPGVALTGNPTPKHVEGVIRVRLGPISTGFRGAARIERDPATMSGRIVGMGTDHHIRSSTRGEVRYRLLPVDAGTATRVEISVGYSMQGMLAQIAREGLVRGLAARLTAEFARNLERELSGAATGGPTRPAASIDGVALVFDRLRMFVREIFRRT
ncbi:SRPBCC family protein [Bradyrhizobium diazoefficiens]|nr:2Fe-2S iron-sulfur cluster-binding protein [Bradyrhizobium diazoefficiens]MBR0774693.1 SRPBCC family protein [Bradyrhizobium diazoefficiens]